MPIHLAPISRRQFFKRSLAAGAGLALGSELLAAAKPTNAQFWALLSDTHLAADRTRLERGINMTEHFLAVSRELRDLPENPAAVLINGDCAFSSGETADYSLLADLLMPLREAQMPIHLALGNHDNRERFWGAFQEEQATHRPLADRQTALIRTGYANWF